MTLEHKSVAKFFKEQGCVLLEERYVNSRSKMRYICKCGEESEITFNHFKRGQRCRLCGGRRKLTLETVKKDFADKGLTLLTSKYVNSITKMPYICSCGRQAEITYGNFYNGKRCAGCGGTEKFTYDIVEKAFSDAGCVLLAKKYVNCVTKMPYVCKCGCKAVISFYDFQRGHRCRKCAIKRQRQSQEANGKAYTYDFVKSFFEAQGCILLSTQYINCFAKLSYVCNCGRTALIDFHKFKSGQRCVECGGTKKLSFEFVKEYFESQGCTLLATEYINNEKKMPYVCSCGNESEIKFGSFRQGHRCKECSGDRIASNMKYDFKYVMAYFTMCGCILLSSEYFNVHMNLSYICNCGRQDQITFASFLKGRRCKKCWRRKAGESGRLTKQLWAEADLDVDIEKIINERRKSET